MSNLNYKKYLGWNGEMIRSYFIKNDFKFPTKELIKELELNIIEGNYEFDSKIETTNLSIYLKDSMLETRKNYAIIHCIAHLLLHEGESFIDYNFNSKIIDREANKFTRDVLMPTYIINHFRSINLKPQDMAKLLGVSESAVNVRIGEMLKNKQLIISK